VLVTFNTASLTGTGINPDATAVKSFQLFSASAAPIQVSAFSTSQNGQISFVVSRSNWAVGGATNNGTISYSLQPTDHTEVTLKQVIHYQTETTT